MITYSYKQTEHIFSDEQGYLGAFEDGRKLGQHLDCQGVKIVPFMKTNNEVDALFSKLGFTKIVT